MVNVAPSLNAVAERAQRFFSPNSARMNELHQEIISPLSEIGEVLIVGGVIRDLAFYGADERPISDIDFVVTGRVRQLDLLADKLGATKNRFGGYGLKRGGYKIDFWSMHNTWAKVNKFARVHRPKDMVRTTFFDWDAIVYSVNERNIYAIPSYIDRLNRRILDLNLVQNPSTKGNLVRALRRLVMWDARPGRRLGAFLSEHLDAANWAEITAAESHAFHVCYLKQFGTSLDFRRKVLARTSNFTTGVDSRRQQSFDFV